MSSAFWKDYFLEQTKLYVDGVLTRVFPPFAKISEEADNAAEQAWRSAMNAPAWSDRVDESMIAEAARDHGVETYRGLHFLKREVFNSASSGLYHLWEKFTKELLDHASSWAPPILPNPDWLAKAKHDDLLQTFCKSGASISYETAEELNILRLVANVSKHGHGKSFTKLIDREPTLFDAPRSIARPEDLFVGEVRFSKFGECILQFWDGVPEYLDSRWASSDSK
ncbi:MAG: hypothetical protein WAW96_14350 [Alphaproteobacteria bacterium]